MHNEAEAGLQHTGIFLINTLVLSVIIFNPSQKKITGPVLIHFTAFSSSLWKGSLKNKHGDPGSPLSSEATFSYSQDLITRR